MLDYKDNYIIKQLIHANTILKLSDLQEILGMSQRSIYYSLERINDYLNRLELPTIINKRGVGLLVHDKVIEHFEKNELDIKEAYICTSRERNYLQVLYILLSQDYINISLIMERFHVSRSTVIKDLRDIRIIVAQYNLVLEYDIERGYEIRGSELQKRSLALVIHSDFQYLIELKAMRYYDDKDMEAMMARFVKVEEQLGVIYVRSTLQQVAILLAIIKRTKLKPVTFDPDDERVLRQSKEYQVVASVFQDFFDPSEYLYLAMHLLALRIQVSKHGSVEGDDQYVKELVHFIMNEFYNLTLIDIKHSQELLLNLYTHMKPALFRFKFNIIYRNELKNQIMNEFGQVYRVTKIITKKLEKIIDYVISEDEIAYIAIYLGAMIEKEQQMVDHPRVLLLSLSGRALARNLKKEIESFTKDVVLIEAYRLSDVTHLKDSVEYIISTEPIKDIVTKAKMMVVNPILNDRERYRIIQFLGISVNNASTTEVIDRIMHDIDEFVSETKKDEVRDIIKSHLTSS